MRLAAKNPFLLVFSSSKFPIFYSRSIKLTEIQTRPFSSQNSDSLQQFSDHLKFLAKDSRFVPESDGFVWVTKDKKIREFLAAQKFNIFGRLLTGELDDLTRNHPVTRTEIGILDDQDFRESRDYLSQRPTINVASGGISALWVSYLLSTLYKENFFPDYYQPPICILPPDLKNSAAYFGSSLQFHVSHATPMYTDSEFSSLKILKQTLLRNLSRSLDSPKRDNYLVAELNLKSLFDSETWQVSLGYFYHELKYNFQKQLGVKTISDETIQIAIDSGKIMDQVGRELGQDILLRKTLCD